MGLPNVDYARKGISIISFIKEIRMDIKKLFGHIITEQRQRYVICRIDNNKIIGEKLRLEGIHGGEGYFIIRLSEMFLKNRREWWVGFNPLAIAITDFFYNQTNQTIPIYIGNQLLKTIESQIQDQFVEYRNTKIIGPVVYNGGDVGLFIGLFRVQVNDYSRQLFDFIESIIGTFHLSQLDSYIALADNINKGLAGLFGLKEVQLQIGFRNVYNETGPDANQFKDGYFLMAACPRENLQTENLWIKDGALHIGEDEGHLVPFQSDDYCLFKIEQSDERTDFRSLKFNSQWEKIISELYDRRFGEADHLLLSLMKEIAKSPELIRKQKLRLIQVYKANYEKEVEISKGILPSLESIPTRGGRITMDAQTVIQKIAYSADKRKYDPSVPKALIDISKNLNGIIGHRNFDKPLNDNEILSQMRVLDSVSTVSDVDPIALVSAMVSDSLDPN